MSEHQNPNGLLLLDLLLVVGYIATVIYTGTIAWSWTTPQSFGGAIHFLFWWSALFFVGKLILGAVYMFFGSQVDK